MQTVEHYARFCPGEEHIRISDAVCYGRRRVNFPKCKGCQFNDDERERQDNRKLLAPGVVIDRSQSPRIEQVLGPIEVQGRCPDPFDEDTAWRLGFACGTFLRAALRGMDRSDPDVHRVVVGHDARESSPGLARAAISGVQASGAPVINVGLVDTPQLYFAVNHLSSCGGIMVTGGAAPLDHNGMRMCGRRGIPISPDTGLHEISVISSNTAPHKPQSLANVERADLTEPYRDFVLGFLEQGRPLKVVMDAAHGSAGAWVPAVFGDSGDIELEALRTDLDETLALPPDSTLREVSALACQEVEAMAADFGVCFDGDAERCTFIDETGEVVPGDIIGTLLADAFIRRLEAPRLVQDVRCSRVFGEHVRRAGGQVRRDASGRTFIHKAMSETQAVFGCEGDGRCYFQDNTCSSSAFLTIVHVINILSHTDRTLSELVAPFRKYHASGELFFHHDDPRGAMQEIAARFADTECEVDFVDGITVTFPAWWFNLRQDGFKPRLRLNMEANTGELLGQHMSSLAPLLGEPIDYRS